MAGGRVGTEQWVEESTWSLHVSWGGGVEGGKEGCPWPRGSGRDSEGVNDADGKRMT